VRADIVGGTETSQAMPALIVDDVASAATKLLFHGAFCAGKGNAGDDPLFSTVWLPLALAIGSTRRTTATREP
jgi:hypothetical protein